jgi:hypothetical protein
MNWLKPRERWPDGGGRARQLPKKRKFARMADRANLNG